MGMAPYGQPRYLDKLEKLIRVHRDGSFVLDMDYFSFHHALSDTYGRKFVDLFGPPRPPESPFFTRTTGDDIRGRESESDRNQYYADVAASVQVLTERILLETVHHLHRTTGEKHLVLAGGVALNSVANGRIMRDTPFEQVYIQPNAGDAGGALGAALYVWHVVLGKPRRFVMAHAYHGEAYAPAAIERFLRGRGIGYERVEDPGHLADQLVDAILQKRVVGFFQGRFEWGPRALGNRSILADPRDAAMKEVVNSKIKFRESFRPFAPVVTAGAAGRYFDLGKAKEPLSATLHADGGPGDGGPRARNPGGCPPGRHRAFADRVPRGQPDLSRRHRAVRPGDRRPGAPQHELQPSRRTDRDQPANVLNTFAKSDIDVLALGPFLVRKDAGRVRSVAVGEVAGTSPGADAINDGLVVCSACRGAVASEATATGETVACRACGRRFETADGIPLLYWPTDESQIDRVSEVVQGFYEKTPFPVRRRRHAARSRRKRGAACSRDCSTIRCRRGPGCSRSAAERGS